MNDVTIPATGSQIRIIAEGTVTAHDPGSDAVQLDHGECWWPYSDGDNAVRFETIAPPPTLLEKVARVRADQEGVEWDELSDGDRASLIEESADLLAVIADGMATRPLLSGDPGEYGQRDADVAWLRGEQS